MPAIEDILRQRQAQRAQEPLRVSPIAPKTAPQRRAEDILRRRLRERMSLQREADIPFATRAGASVKLTPAGRLGYLQSELGVENVSEGPDGQLLVRRDPTEEWRPMDIEKLTVGDIADWAGPALQIVPTLLAGTNPYTVAGATMLGEGARQGVAAMLPGEETLTPAQRALQIGGAGLMGGAAQKGINVATRGIDFLRPRNIIARRARRAAETPYALKGERLGREIGRPLMFDEQTGSRFLKQVSAIARRTTEADTYFHENQRQMRAALGKLDRALGRIGEKRSPYGYSSDLRNAYDTMAQNMRNLRRAQWNRDWDMVRVISKDQPIIPLRRTIDEMEDIIAEYDIPGDTVAKSVVKGVKDMMEGLRPKAGEQARVTPTTVQRLLSRYGKASRGQATLMKDLEKAEQRALAARLFGALKDDLDDIPQDSVGDLAARAIREARDNWRDHSQALQELAESVVATIVEKKGTDSASSLAMRGFVEQAVRYPDEMLPDVKAFFHILDREAPAVARSGRRYMVEKALFSAEEAARRQVTKRATGPGSVTFSATDFLKQLPRDDVLRAAGFSRRELVEIKQVAKYLERIADKQFEGSPTTPMKIVWDATKDAFSLNFGEAIKGLGHAGQLWLGMDRIAKAMMDPRARRALLTVTRTGAPTRKALGEAAYLSAFFATTPERYGEGTSQERQEEPMQEAVQEPARRSYPGVSPGVRERMPAEQGQSREPRR